MFWTILHREIRQGLTSFVFLFILAVLSAIVLLSSYTQAREYQRILADHTLRRSIHEAENNHEAVVINKTVPPLLPFFNGIYANLPDEITLRADSLSPIPSSEDLDPLKWFSADPDLGLIIGVLLTLMAVFISHDTITGEREQGTLRLILANPITRRSVLLAKMMGIILLMTLILLYSVSLYVVTILAVSGGTYDLSRFMVLELAVICLAGLLILVVFAVLGVLVSAATKSSSFALGISLAIWIAAVVIWPSIAPGLASSVYPAPSIQEVRRLALARKVELDRGEIGEHRKAAADLAARRVPVEVAWQQYLDIRHRWLDRKERDIGLLIESHRTQIDHQQSIAKRLIAASPFGAFQEILGDICDTGLGYQESFLSSVEHYGREEFISASFKFMADEKPWRTSPDNKERFQTPPFRMPVRSLSERLQEAAPLMGLLILQIGLLSAISLWRFERYDVQ